MDLWVYDTNLPLKQHFIARQQICLLVIQFQLYSSHDTLEGSGQVLNHRPQRCNICRIFCGIAGGDIEVYCGKLFCFFWSNQFSFVNGCGKQVLKCILGPLAFCPRSSSFSSVAVSFSPALETKVLADSYIIAAPTADVTDPSFSKSEEVKLTLFCAFSCSDTHLYAQLCTG